MAMLNSLKLLHSATSLIQMQIFQTKNPRRARDYLNDKMRKEIQTKKVFIYNQTTKQYNIPSRSSNRFVYIAFDMLYMHTISSIHMIILFKGSHSSVQLNKSIGREVENIDEIVGSWLVDTHNIVRRHKEKSI